jgi:hypothetical protein
VFAPSSLPAALSIKVIRTSGADEAVTFVGKPSQ